MLVFISNVIGNRYMVGGPQYLGYSGGFTAVTSVIMSPRAEYEKGDGHHRWFSAKVCTDDIESIN